MKIIIITLIEENVTEPCQVLLGKQQVSKRLYKNTLKFQPASPSCTADCILIHFTLIWQGAWAQHYPSANKTTQHGLMLRKATRHNVTHSGDKGGEVEAGVGVQLAHVTDQLVCDICRHRLL